MSSIKVRPSITAKSALDTIIQEQTNKIYRQTKFPCVVNEYVKYEYRSALEASVRRVIIETYPDLVKKAIAGESVELLVNEEPF